MQQTALCARKIGAFLKPRISPTTLPIYRCAAADAQPVRPQIARLTIAKPDNLYVCAIPASVVHYDGPATLQLFDRLQIWNQTNEL
jgi:hypothetical protein